MSQDLPQGLEKETVELTPEQVKEQKAQAKKESVARGLALLEETQLLGENFGKVVEMAKFWKEAENEERTEARKNYADTFETKEELRVYSAETLVEDIQKIEDIANTLSDLKSVWNGVKKLGGTGKKRISKKDVQTIYIGQDAYQVRVIDIASSQHLDADAKRDFLINAEHTVKVEIKSFENL